MRRLGNFAGVLLVVGYFLFAAIVLVLRYAILPNIDHYRPDLEALASHAVKQRVTIAAVRADWVGLRPRLTLTDLVVHDDAERIALKLPEVGATLAWESLSVLSLRLHTLRITSPELDIRRDADGRLSVGGILVDPSDRSTGEGFLPWLLAQTEVVVTRAHVHWTDTLRGAPLLDLTDVSLELSRTGVRYRFAATATPPATLASPLDVRGHFERDLFALNNAPDRFSGEVYASLGFVDLAAWHDWLGYPFEITKGAGALRAWIHFTDASRHGARTGRLYDVVADLHLSGLLGRAAPDLQSVEIRTLDGRIALQQSSGGDHLTLRGFSIAGADGLSLPSTDLDARRVLDTHGAVVEAAVSASRLDLHTLSDLLGRVPLPGDVKTLLTRYQPRGLLKALQLAWHGPLVHPSSYRFTTQFEGIGIAAPAANGSEFERPGFENLSGAIRADERGGTLTVHGQNATLSLPGLFADPVVPLEHFNLVGQWTQAGENLEVRIDTLNFDNADAAGSASGLYRRGPLSTSKGPGYLDLTAHLSRADARRVSRYMPQTIPEDARSYVERAILAGSSDDVTFRVRGALERFPFRQSAPAAARSAAPLLVKVAAAPAEEFRINARLHGVKLDYAPRPPAAGPKAEELWPPLEDIEADLTLERNHMEIVGHSARAYGFKLDRITAVLPDLDDHDEVLSVRAQGSGPLSDLLHVIASSPIDGWLEHATAGTRALGPAHLELNLSLPLSHLDDSRVNGSVAFQNNDITLFPWLPVLAHTSGRLDFTEKGVTLKEGSTQFLGGTTKIDVSTADDHFITMHAEGQALGAALRRETGMPTLAKFAERLDGTAAYKVTMNLAPRSADEHAIVAHGPKLVIESSLVGLAIDLPVPLKKTASELLPLRVEFDAGRTQRDETTDQIRARIGPLLSAVFARRQNAAGEMDVVHAAYSVGEPAALTDARAFASITLPALDLDAWQDVFNDLGGPNLGATLYTPPGAESPLVPDSIAARVQSLHVNEKTFGNVVLNAQHSGSNWQANVSSDEVAGQINWRQGGVAGTQQNRITARLSKLVVPRSATKEVTTLLEAGPTSLPALDITAENFELRDKKLGRLELLASNSVRAGHREWRLEKLNLENPDGSLEATGSWGTDGDAQGAQQHTHMDFKIDARDIGGLLDRLDLKGTVKGGSATLKGDISWRGTPLALDYDSLSGDLNLKASRGQFLKAEPGAAKLLGVLSLQSLTRRLTLDFTDLFAGGFAFDSIDADANVKDGLAVTHNFSMRGVSANVSIEGSADLARETQNLHVRVLPQVNLGTGSIAYALLVNPVIGLGTLALGEVLRDPLSKALAFEYNISGPWAEPVIVPIERGLPVPAAPTNLPNPSGPLVPVAPPAAPGPAPTGPPAKPATSG